MYKYQLLIVSEPKQEMILNCSRNVLNVLCKRTILSYYLKNSKIFLIIFIGIISLLLIVSSTDFLKDVSKEPDLKKGDGYSVKKRLPDFFIVGVKKSGTTTLGMTLKSKKINSNNLLYF